MKFSPISLAALAGLAAIHAHAAPAIYEPFNQDFSSDANLNGKAGGDGLNTWSDTQTVQGEAESLFYGNLQHTGNQVRISNGNGTDAWVTMTSALKDATSDPNGLLADGETLWMSFMWSKASNGGSNEWSGVAFGTDRLDATFSGINMTNSGNGLGIATRGNALNASTWEGGGNASQGSGISYDLGDSVFVVAKFEWGSTAGDVDTITLYTPSLSDLGTLGPSVSKTTSAGVDQTAFDTFSVSLRNSGGDTIIDEIRFGATVEDVIVENQSGTPYDTWAAGPFSAALTDQTPSLDFDGGGLETELEWVLGGDPTLASDDLGLVPSFDSSDPANFVFTFTRRDDADSDSNTSIVVEYGSDLTGWNPATNGVNGVTIDDTVIPAPGFRTVVVSIPKILAVNDRLFARLEVDVTNP